MVYSASHSHQWPLAEGTVKIFTGTQTACFLACVALFHLFRDHTLPIHTSSMPTARLLHSSENALRAQCTQKYLPYFAGVTWIVRLSRSDARLSYFYGYCADIRFTGQTQSFKDFVVVVLNF